jgi:hypothetical protein
LPGLLLLILFLVVAPPLLAALLVDQQTGALEQRDLLEEEVVRLKLALPVRLVE